MRIINLISVSWLIILLVLVGPLTTLQASAETGMEGPAILTIAGKIENPNRGEVDEFKDGFFTSQDVEFTKARAFTLKALNDLPAQKITVKYPNWPKAFTFEGPRLVDVLKLAGANGEVINLKALDGYAVEMPMADVHKSGAILALKMDGAYLGLGGRGPSWLIMPNGTGEKKDDSGLIWSIYFIEVR